MEVSKETATAHVYRFRSTRNLLGRKELELSEIYFAAPEQLNDPLEGHIDLYWEGDEVIWRNLFRHYLNCVIYAFMLYVAAEDENKTAQWKDLHIRDPLVVGILPQHAQISERVFNHEIVGCYIERICKTNRRVGPNELAAHLEAIHPFVVHAAYLWHWDNAPSAALLASSDFSATLEHTVNRVHTSMQMMDQFEVTCDNDFRKREDKYKLLMLGTEENSLLRYYRNFSKARSKNQTFIHNDFCRIYVQNLRTLMYPRWFAASFMERCDGEAMWAYYGDSHQGICLIYKTSPDAVGRPSLSIRTPCGVTGRRESDIVYQYMRHQFLPVTYEAEHIELNFFDTLHAVTVPVLSSQWLRDRDGGVSRFGNRSQIESSDWRSAYWQDARRSSSTKTRAWQSEQECRLVYQSDGFNLDFAPALRAMKYDFFELEGIIFGIRTPASEKLEIVRIIEQRCKEVNRTKFDFYQAVQSRTGAIDKVKLHAISDIVDA